MKPSAIILGLGLALLIVVACGDGETGETTTATLDLTPTIGTTAKRLPIFEQSPCPFDIPAEAMVECGFVVVPEIHDNPTGPTIKIAVATFKDQSDERQPDPVMLLAGGPGEKTVHSAAAIARLLALPHRDLIVFDQRGAGLSEPALECPEYVAAFFTHLNEPDSNVSLKAAFDSIVTCRDRLMNEGHNLSAYNTVQNAADVDDIRVALGYDKVNLYGGSYGSLLAQAVMRDHPDGIRSVAVNSVLPLEKSIFVQASLTTTSAIIRLLDTCAADEACNTAYPDLRQELFEVIDRLNLQPLPITLTNPSDGQRYDAVLTGDGVVGNLVTFLYLTQIIPALPQAVHDLHAGDYGLVTELGSTRLALIDLSTRGMMFSVLCSEDLIGRTREDLLRNIATLPRQLAGTGDPEVMAKYGIFGICDYWLDEEADAWVKNPLFSNIPTLILEGEFDPVTPPEYGRLVADNLSNSYFFEFPGIGHDVLGSSECARSIVVAFLDEPAKAPERSCIDAMPGVVFDVPGEQAPLILERFADDERGFSGLVPVGWTELAPANLMRGSSALDLTYFVLEASTKSASDLLASLAAQLAFDPDIEPIATNEVGNFVWEFYSFERRGYPADLVISEDNEKAYFILMLSSEEERPFMYEELFLPALRAMAALN